jgi:hypothetical protein
MGEAIGRPLVAPRPPLRHDCQHPQKNQQTEQGQRRKRERKQQQVEHANPKASVHIHGEPSGDAAARMMRPTTTPSSASTS